VADLETQLERLRAVLPEEKDVADLLRRIQGMATQSNLTIRAFTPRPVATKQMHNLGGFLERVSKFPRIINVNAIDIRARENQTESATVTAECTATTFVLLENAAAKPAAPGAPGAPGAAPRPSS
jgi:Tfp pilus assembly protein PilO